MLHPQRSAKEIFLAAAEIAAPADRAAYLQDACGNDTELRHHVEALLRVHEVPDSLLDQDRIGAHVVIEREGVSSLTIDQPLERPGTQIGPYKLLQQIGEGGMGVVYMAEQTEPIARRVALKIIKPGMDTRQVIARFEAERQALALMDHVNIARVLDAGTTPAGLPYFVMELVNGVPITKYCDDNRLTPRQRLELFVPVCQAIQHAHQKGIIHRDIKPSNVMVTLYDGKPVPKVIDFGVAKATEQKLTEQTLFTQYGTMVGTLEYMSPEQAEMSALGVDTRSDIYSLGVLLYELLTGNTPLSHKTMKEAAYAEILRMIKEEEPPKPSTRLSDSGEALASISAQRHTEPARLTRMMRGELDWIVMKTLEKDRNRRYETANGFAMDVQRYLNDEPVQACPPTAGYRFRKFARRNKAALAMAGVVLSALLLGTIGLAVSNVLVRAEHNQKDQALSEKVKALGEKQVALTQAQTNFVEARKQAGIARRQEQIATEQTMLAKRRLYASQMNLAMQAWRAGEMPRVLELLEGQRPKLGEQDLRGFEWYYLWRLCNGGRRHLHGHTNAVLSLSYSPDGKTLASAGSDGTVRLWNTATGREHMVLRGHTTPPWDVAFSPDGKLLASGGKTTNELILWNVADGQPIHTISATVDRLAFSPDGGTVLGGGLSTRLWDVASGQERAAFPDEAGLMVGMLPDGKTVVTLAAQFTETCEVRFWDVEKGTRRLTIPLRGLNDAVLSPDGSRLATAAWWSVKVWDTATGQQQASYATQSDMRGVAFSRDGKRLAAGDGRRAVVWDLETSGRLGEDAHRDVVWAVAFSPDSKAVASATLGGDIKLWDMTPPDEAASIEILSVADLRFSQDGRTLLVGNSGPTSIVDVSAGKEVAVLPVSGALAFSAKGETAARFAGDTQAVVWDTRSGREIARLPLPQPNGGSPGITLSPGGKHAATFVSFRGDDKTVRLWDIATQQARSLTSDIHENFVNCAEFSPDGKLLAAGFQFQWVIVWDVATGKVKLRFAQQPAMMWVKSLKFSPDSKALAVGTDIGAVTLWNVETGQRLADFRGHTSHVFALTFSPDGEVLATAGADKTVRLWDTRTGQERSTLAGHKGQVTQVLFSPDGNTLATASRDDGTVRLWRAATDPDALAPRIADPVSTSVASLVLPAGAFELTEAGLREAIDRWPDDAGLRRRLGRLLQAQGQIAEAATSLAEVARLEPERVDDLVALAEVLRQQQKFAEAEAALREAIRLNPSRPWTHETLGFLLSEQKKFAEAEPNFREAIRLNPDLIRAHYGLGEALHEQKKFAEALVPLRAAARVDPTNPYIRGRLGWVLLNLGQPAEAELEFRERIHLLPDDSEGHVSLGRALLRQKKLSEAIDCLREAIRLNPKHPWVHDVLGWAYIEQQQFSQAEAEFREQVGLKPEAPSGHFGLGKALQSQKKSAEAIAPLREAIRLDPSNHQSHVALGWALVLTERFAESEFEFREVIRLQPDLATGHFGLGRALVDQKRFADAELSLREALRLEPAHSGARQLLALALTRQAKHAEAEALLKEQPGPNPREAEKKEKPQ